MTGMPQRLTLTWPRAGTDKLAVSADVRQIERDPPPAKLGAACALSVDVEDWFHAANLSIPPGYWAAMPSRIERNTDTVLRLLSDYDTRATFFVLGWIADRYPSVVRRIREDGHEVTSHGYWHRPVHSMTPAGFADDLERSIEAIGKACSCRPFGFRAPSYSIDDRTPWAFDILEELGFRYDSSVYPARALHGRYGSAKGLVHPYRPTPGLWEIPMPTLSVCGRRFPAATGAYLRILPLAVTVRTIEQNLRAHNPVVINFHPWELDPHQPRVAVPWWERTLHYTALNKTCAKLESLLRRYRFETLDTLVRRLENKRVVTEASAQRRHLVPVFGSPTPHATLESTFPPDQRNDRERRKKPQFDPQIPPSR